MERTFVMLKPDCIQRGMIGRVISIFEEKGLKIVGVKMVWMGEKECKEQYIHHADKPFFPNLLKFMCSTPVLCMVIEGIDAVEVVRKICGATNSRLAEPGTIRGDFSMSIQKNLIHASDSKETAEKEIKRFFKLNEIFSYPTNPALYAEEER